MARNMGILDRSLRAFVVAPVAIVVAVIVGTTAVAGIILFVVAGLMLATAATGYCPNYTLAGISTDPRPHRIGHHHLRGGHA
jgi:Inner membrane protein YgaP-like, transmembrane domain